MDNNYTVWLRIDKYSFKITDATICSDVSFDSDKVISDEFAIASLVTVRANSIHHAYMILKQNKNFEKYRWVLPLIRSS